MICPVCLHDHPEEEMREGSYLKGGFWRRGRIVIQMICWYCLIGDFIGDPY